MGLVYQVLQKACIHTLEAGGRTLAHICSVLHKQSTKIRRGYRKLNIKYNQNWNRKLGMEWLCWQKYSSHSGESQIIKYPGDFKPSACKRGCLVQLYIIYSASTKQCYTILSNRLKLTWKVVTLLRVALIIFQRASGTFAPFLHWVLWIIQSFLVKLQSNHPPSEVS